MSMLSKEDQTLVTDVLRFVLLLARAKGSRESGIINTLKVKPITSLVIRIIKKQRYLSYIVPDEWTTAY